MADDWVWSWPPNFAVNDLHPRHNIDPGSFPAGDDLGTRTRFLCRVFGVSCPDAGPVYFLNAQSNPSAADGEWSDPSTPSGSFRRPSRQSTSTIPEPRSPTVSFHGRHSGTKVAPKTRLSYAASQSPVFYTPYPSTKTRVSLHVYQKPMSPSRLRRATSTLGTKAPGHPPSPPREQRLAPGPKVFLRLPLHPHEIPIPLTHFSPRVPATPRDCELTRKVLLTPPCRLSVVSSDPRSNPITPARQPPAPPAPAPSRAPFHAPPGGNSALQGGRTRRIRTDFGALELPRSSRGLSPLFGSSTR